MNYKKINVPFLSNIAIRKKAESFTQKFWDNSIPVDIENIIDLKLKLDIVPRMDLQKHCDADALITSNWRSVYVDCETTVIRIV